MKARIEFQNSELIDGVLQNSVELAHFATVITDDVEIIVEIPNNIIEQFSDLFSGIEQFSDFFSRIEEVGFELSDGITDNLKKQLNIEGKQLFLHLSDGLCILDFAHAHADTTQKKLSQNPLEK